MEFPDFFFPTEMNSHIMETLGYPIISYCIRNYDSRIENVAYWLNLYVHVNHILLFDA